MAGSIRTNLVGGGLAVLLLGVLGWGAIFLIGLAKSPRPLDGLWPNVGIDVHNEDSVAWPVGPLSLAPGGRIRLYHDRFGSYLDWSGGVTIQGRPLPPPTAFRREETAYGRYRSAALEAPWKHFLQAPVADGPCNYAFLDSFRADQPGLVVKVYSDDQVRVSATQRYHRSADGSYLLDLHDSYGSLAPSGSRASADDRFRCRSSGKGDRLGLLGAMLDAIWPPRPEETTAASPCRENDGRRNCASVLGYCTTTQLSPGRNHGDPHARTSTRLGTFLPAAALADL